MLPLLRVSLNDVPVLRQVKTRLEASQADLAASAGDTLRLNGNHNGDNELSMSQKMESCCT